MTKTTNLYLACDIGTNAMRIMVGRVVPCGRGLRVQKQSFIRLPLRLGDDVFNTGRIGTTKLKQLGEACRLMNALAHIYQVDSTRTTATSAVRESANRDEVVATMAEQGVQLDVIDGEEEASLVQLVVQHLESIDSTNQLFIDVGGGSTELVHFGGSELHMLRSFKIGTVRELVGKSIADEWDKLSEWVSQEHCQALDLVVVGTGGTINTMAKIAANQEPLVNLAQIDEFIDEATQLSNLERQLRWDMRADKADVIVFGCAIYSRILRMLGADAIVVPKVGLADGLVLQAYLQATGANA